MDSDVYINKRDRGDHSKEISRGVWVTGKASSNTTAGDLTPEFFTPTYRYYFPGENLPNTSSQESINYRLRAELIEMRDALYDLFLAVDDTDKVSALIARTNKLIDELEQAAYPPQYISQPTEYYRDKYREELDIYFNDKYKNELDAIYGSRTDYDDNTKPSNL